MTMNARLISLLTILLICIAYLPSGILTTADNGTGEPYSEDWPMFRLDLLHTGFKEGPAPDTNQSLWVANTTDNRYVVSSPMIVDDHVYIGSDDGKLYKFFLENGTEVWNYTAGPGTRAQFWSSPFVDKENNMVLCHASGVHAINMTTGERIWHFETNTREFSSPVVHDGVVFVGSYSKYVYALPQTDPNGDGTISDTEVIWRYQAGEYQNGNHVEGTGGAVSTTLVIVDGMVIGAEQTNYDEGNNYCDYNIFCLPEEDPDGSKVIEHDEIIWKYEIGEHIPLIDTGCPGDNGDCFSSASVNKDLGQVYIGSRDQHMYCFALEPQDDGFDNDLDGIDNNEGELLWRTSVDNEIFSTPSIYNGNIYFGSGQYSYSASPGSVYCLNESDGVQVWRYQNADGFLSSPLVADDKVFIGSNDENLYSFYEENGTVMWSYHPAGGSRNAVGSSPSLYDDIIVVGSCNGNVYAFHTSNYPPEIELLSPGEGSIFTSTDSPMLLWSGSDPNPWDILTYDVYVSTNLAKVENEAVSARVGSGQTHESYSTTGLEEGTKYFWKVVVSDGEYETGSRVRSFFINTGPEIQLETPLDEKIVASVDVTLTWRGEDDDGDDLSYDVYLDTDSDPATLISGDTTDDSLELSDLQDGETYYWKVVVKDGYENVSSEIWSFSINIQAASNNPPSVLLLYPESGDIIDTTEVTVTWSGEDDDGDPLTYTLYLEADEEPETVIVEDAEYESYELTGLPDGETYYWKVVVSDGVDDTGSDIWSFTIDLDFITNEPPEIELTFPVNGMNLTENSLNLLWSGSDKDRDRLSYDVYLGIEPDTTTLVSSDQSAKSYLCLGLLKNQTYYWYIVVKDGTHEVSSETRSFTIAKEQQDEEDNDDDSLIEDIVNEPLYLGGLGALFCVVAFLVIYAGSGKRRYDDEEYYGQEDWSGEDDWGEQED